MTIDNRELAPGTKLEGTHKQTTYICEVVTTPEGEVRFKLEDGRPFSDDTINNAVKREQGMTFSDYYAKKRLPGPGLAPSPAVAPGARRERDDADLAGQAGAGTARPAKHGVLQRTDAADPRRRTGGVAMTAARNLRADVIKPLPAQARFLDAMWAKKYILFGGAAGPGKSHILRWSLVEFHL